MSLLAVARKDFEDSIRSRWLWVLSVLFVLFAGGLSYLATALPQLLGLSGSQAGGVTTAALLTFLLGASGFFVPIIGMMIGYKAVVGERETGQLKLLLSLPHTRDDAVLGKVLGRSASLAVAVLVGFGIAVVVVLVRAAQFDPVAYALFVLVTIAFGGVYVAIGVGFSALTASSSRALALAILFLVVFEFLWSWVIRLLQFVANGFTLSLEQMFVNRPEWARFLGALPPGEGYGSAARAVISGLGSGGGPGQGGPDALYLQDWFGFVVLAFWLAVPLGIGLYRFRSVDLG